MRKVKVTRDTMNEKVTLGICTVVDQDNNVMFTSESLELPWKDNERNISCVPEGIYPLKLEYSGHFKKDLWELYEVPNRSECKFHVANYVRQLNGCIALGQNRADIDGDGTIDITSSGNTIKEFHKAMGDIKESTVEIVNAV